MRGWLSALTMMILAMMTLASCTNGPCRQLKNPELANQQVRSAQPQAGLGGGSTVSGTTQASKQSSGQSGGPSAGQTTVLVYKPDGSLQCGQGKTISAQEMEKELKGIKVLKRENRSDGMMHIQVCGSPTGMVNVYEISAESLKEAEKRGFKKFEP